jgi:Zn-dependent protease with chaperone function
VISPAPIPTSDELRRTALEEIPGRIPAPPTTFRYLAGLAAVAAAMVALPLLYFALVALVGLGVYAHAVSNLWLLQGGRGAILRFIAYFSPIVAGTVIVWVLFRPLFSRLPQPIGQRRLSSAEEPFLFDFVKKLCAAVGAPAPSEIVVDLQVNAFAGADLGLVRAKGGKLVLGIGLPLVAGLSLTQFAGVLAHEFGHFSQGAGMRLSRVIRSIHLWFARVIYERDEWDETIEEWRYSNNGYLAILGALTHFCLSLARMILYGLMTAGRVVSGFFVRQMELDADRYETRLVGPAVFESTVRSLECLQQASEKAYSELAEAAKWGILPRDLPAAIVRRMTGISPGDPPSNEVGDGRTKLFDTHPSNHERIEYARAEAVSVSFNVDAPATLLFQDFETLSREVTLEHYRQLFDRSIEESNLVPDEDLVARSARAEATSRTGETFYLGLCDPSMPFFPSQRRGSNPGSSPREQLDEARARLVQALPEARRARHRILNALYRWQNAARAGLVLRKGLPVPKSAAEWTEEDAAASARKARGDRDESFTALAPFHDAMRDRIVAALELDSDPAGSRKAAHGLALLAALREVHPAIDAVHGEISVVASLLQEYESSDLLSRDVVLAIDRLRQEPMPAMESLPAFPTFPLSPEVGTSRTLADRLGEHLIERGYDGAIGLVRAYSELYHGTLNELALRVREIEANLNLPEIDARQTMEAEGETRPRRRKSRPRSRRR